VTVHPRSALRTRHGPRAALGAVALLLLAAACSSTPSAQPKKDAPPTTTGTTVPRVLCPLTGEPAPYNTVPEHPALAVKVDNYPIARPQSGIDKADIIFEEPVEGGITRYVAVFQCQDASLVGPIRSARNIDIGILTEFGSPLLAHVGGINPVLANIDASPLINLDLGAFGQVIQHVPGRYAPYDTYASTQALYGLKPTDKTVPAPVFRYSSTVPIGNPVASVAIPFSGTSNVVWRYNPTNERFMRYYGSQPDMLADNVQNMAANVIIQTVQVTYGPWLENEEGGLEVQAQLSGTSGPVQVLRDGVDINGTWQRSSPGSPTQFVSGFGQPITLTPGPTWVELVPSTVQVTSTRPAPANTSTTSPTTTSAKRSSTSSTSGTAPPTGTTSPSRG